MLKVGLFGGSFNPIHNGHVNLALGCMEQLKLDKLLIIPTAVSPHKQKANVSFEHRAEMCRLAFSGQENCEVSSIEKELGGKNYTINTVHALKRLYPADTRFFLIIGGDMLYSFRKWYRYQELMKECRVTAAARQEDDYADMLEFAAEIGRVKVLNLPVKEVSSTEIRERLKNGEDAGGLLPAGVEEYIIEKGLYK